MIHHHILVVAGFRHKADGFRESDLREPGFLDRDADAATLLKILTEAHNQHGAKLIVIGLGADRNFALMLRSLCELRQIPFAEYLVLFNQYVPKRDYQLFFFARHGALLDLLATPGASIEYHLFVNRPRMSAIEDLVTRVRASGQRYTVYSEVNDVVEHREAQSPNVQGQPEEGCRL